jgi:hypothetical protein
VRPTMPKLQEVLEDSGYELNNIATKCSLSDILVQLIYFNRYSVPMERHQLC